ncbi:MAG: sigma 54-interacting transcriptional regulator [Gemmataceae bacterium]
MSSEAQSAAGTPPGSPLGGSRLLVWPRRIAHALWTDGDARCRGWIVVAGLLACLYSFAVLGYVLSWPEIGVRCAFTPVVNYFYEGFLYPEQQEPLRSGDRITALGGQTVETWSQLLRKMMQLRDEAPDTDDTFSDDELRQGQVPPNITHLRHQGQRLVRVSYERNEEAGPLEGSVWVRLGRSPIETLLPGILWFCLNIGLFIVGAMVYWKRPQDRSAGQFFTVCLVTLGAFMGGYHWSRIVTHPVLIAVFMACAVLLPAVTLHFYLIFPRPKYCFETRRLAALLAIYTPPLVFLVLFFKGYMQVRWLDQGGAPGLLAGIEGALRQGQDDPSSGVRLLLLEILYEIYLYFGIAALWYLCSIGSLVHSYRHAHNTAERNQVKWILIGSATALIPLGYTLYLAFWQSARFGGGAATWPMFAASACITLAYTLSITRYRLLELDQMISSGAIYFLVSFLAGLGYYGVVFTGFLLVGSRTGEGPTLSHGLGVAGAALVLMVALDLLRGRVMRAVERHFHREKYQLDRTLQRMSQAIDRLVDPVTLGRQLLHTSAELLSASRGAIYLRQADTGLFGLTEALGPAPPLTELSPGCPLIERLRIQGTQVTEPASPAARQLVFLGGTVAQALLHEGELLGLLVLGPRTEGAYTSDDLHILVAFTQMSVLALLSAEGHRTIEGLNRELRSKVEKIAEQQRRILALQSQLMKREEASAPALPPLPALLEPVAGAETSSPGGLVGSSPQVQQLLHLVRRVASSSSAVLLRGESGTGKELLARALHESSPRAGRAFIKVHCAALSPGLLESELFGHVKGAFTSAIRDKVGRFEAADGGTLFLDEIGDINLEVQTKLLRVLEEMTFERVGSSEPLKVDVRIIAATHRDLEAMIAEGKFREDLYFRLNVLPIHVPPLRERVEDIPELAMHFLQVYAGKLNKPVRALDDDALAALKAHPWPGNVRQLENVIERAVVIAETPTLGLAELGLDVQQHAPLPQESTWADEAMQALSLPALASVLQADRADREKREREQLVRALAAAGGNKSEAARALGLARSTLISKLKKFGLS